MPTDTLAIDEPTAYPSVFDLIEDWADDRNIIKGSSPQSQFVKLIEEVGELASDIAKGRDVADSIGDAVVVLTILAAQNDYTIEECAWIAYNEIKERKGRVIDGIFVKEEDID